MSANPARGACEDDRCAEPINKGQPARFSGLLISEPLALHYATLANSHDERIAIEINAERKRCGVELEAAARLAEINTEASAARAAVLARQIDELSAWHRSPLFVAAVSFVATIGVVVVAGAATRG